jgi:pyrroline-5-carboxylate reductase
MNILLIGCGNIGSLLLKVWAREKLAHKILVVQPSLSHAKEFENNASIQFVESIKAVPADFTEEVVLLAVKPQQLNEVIVDLAKRPRALILSCLAGVKIDTLSKVFPQHTIIRFMPNVAIKTSQSINLAVASKNVQQNAKDLFEKLIMPTGKIFWLNEERELDELTPITGSGPAFVFLLAELLYQEMIKRGYKADLAKEMIEALFEGSTSLMSGSASYEALVQSVTSKKGITEAALAILRPALEKSLSEAIQAALTRQDVFSNQFEFRQGGK